MITQEELERARAERWRELTLTAADEAPGLAREAGLVRSTEWEHWQADGLARAEAAVEAGTVVELALWPEGLRYTVPEWLELIYVLAGDRHPASDSKREAERGRLSWLAAEVYQLLAQSGAAALGASELRELIGTARTSILAVERALAELARGLKALRVGRRGGENVWQATVAVYPKLAKEMDLVGAVEAAAGLITLRLERQVCDTEAGLAEYFRPVISQARVHAALQGLATAGAVADEAIEGRPGWRMRKSKERLATSD